MENVLNRIFHPKSIAVIGASEVPGKAAERRTRSLIEGGYKGKIFLINPKREKLFNRKAYPSILDINDEVDLVMVVIPPKFISQAVKDSVKMGAKGIVIITAGLGETGEEGKKIEAEILEIANKKGARIIGPNCSGMFSASANMNLLGVPPIKKGPLSIIAQSGNIIDSLTHYANLRGLGFSNIISAGNAIGVKFHEYFEYLNQDKDTKVILTYMEGIKEGDKLVEVAREVSKNKPIVALKVGRSKAGARAAASHTGSLAGDDAIVDAAFRQAGILRVFNVDEMFDIATCFSGLPLPKGKRVAILSEGGGDNSVAADNAEKYGLDVPIIPESTQEKIKPYLLKGMPASNPIDYGGTAEENPDMINKVANVLMEEDLIDSIYITGFFGGFKEIIASHVGELEEKTSNELARLVHEYKKPIVVHTSFANEPIHSLEILKENGIFVTPSSDRAAFALSYMSKFSLNKDKLKKSSLLKKDGNAPDKAKELINKVKGAKRANFLETEARELLEFYNIKLPKAVLVRTQDEAVKAVQEIGEPTAFKIVSPEIVHKSDVGGVLLNIKSENEARDAFDLIIENAQKVSPASRILGILVSPMARKGQECIIGMVRNPQFGPVVMFGIGGIFVEVFKDVSCRVIPPTDIDVDEMVKEIKGYPLLTGIRGEAAKDIDALKDIIIKISKMAIENPEIKEIDLNPVIVHEKGASIVDARIII
ncbi:MAG: acetate--CoA ligase family protein [Deltaproteobacteria bacterium]|nr:acetate--CoA ligase family protein [Deltaproteobacteria bacterium]